MARILKGKPVADAITDNVRKRVLSLREKGIVPTLALLRAGDREDDLSYERGIVKRCDSVGIAVKKIVLPADVESDKFFDELKKMNDSDEIHGILMFRPFPEQLDGEKARGILNISKDVDGCTDGSLAGVFSDTKLGFAPCTAEAAVAVLDYYGIEIDGKKAAVIGRSLVIGRPVSMLLMHRGATVTICHTHTKDVPSVTKNADIVIAATGCPESITEEYLSDGQTIIDVGISWDEEKQKLVGDVDYDNVLEKSENITPVPGGVGSVTTAVLVSHVVTACERQNQ